MKLSVYSVLAPLKMLILCVVEIRLSICTGLYEPDVNYFVAYTELTAVARLCYNANNSGNLYPFRRDPAAKGIPDIHSKEETA